MNIGPHTFAAFTEMARAFHGYPAPGLLIGGYMVERARALLPPGTLFEAVVETRKCLPDAVQILTPLSVGNNWMKVVNLGRYALSLYDKWTGEGHRVYVDTPKLDAWPEIKSWFLKLKPKAEQDTDALFAEIEAAGDAICSTHPVTLPDAFLHKRSMGTVAICPVCTEAYPRRDGAICRGCQGSAPYSGHWRTRVSAPCPPIRTVPVEEAVGKRALHDMTRIEPGVSKGAEFRAGHEIGAGDVCRLQQMGKSRVYVEDDAPEGDWVHENEAAKAFAERMAGDGVCFDPDPHEGKINFNAARDGLLVLNRDRLEAFNLIPDAMCATKKGDAPVRAGTQIAGCRAIPLFLSRTGLEAALSALGDGPLLQVVPLRKARAGILITGTEVFQGLIQDKFAPIITAKLEALGSETLEVRFAPDDRAAIATAVREMLDAGCDLIVTTAGLSVDPDDVTRPALMDAGMTDALYGAPVLPGAMTLTGRMGSAQVIGVPACALYYKTTSLDLLLPRLLAGQSITRKDIARMAEGGLCLSCKVCTFPKCPFGK